MAFTYSLIASNTLTSDTASVSFSSISGTYTDLIIRVTAKCTDDATTSEKIKLAINSDTGANYGQIIIYNSNGTTASSLDDSAKTINTAYNTLSRSSYTGFATSEIYIPNYTSSNKKPMAFWGVGENNSSTEWKIGNNSLLWTGTSAITSVVLTPPAGNFVSGSSFYLYGINKS